MSSDGAGERPASRLSSSSRSVSEYAEATTGHPLEPTPAAAAAAAAAQSTSLGSIPAPQLTKRASEPPQSGNTPYAVYHRSTTSRSSLSLTGVAPSPPVSSPTTGSSTVQPSGSAGSETATSKLQFQTLQGSMQQAGLKPDSLGWAFILSLVHNEAPSKTSLKGKERERDLQQWHKVVELIEQAPATERRRDLKIYMLLPKEAAGNRFSLAALATHILLVKPEERSTDQDFVFQRVVTLSGLRGILKNQQLTLIDYAPGFPSPLPEFDLDSDTFVDALFGPSQQPYMGSPSFSIHRFEDPISVPRQATPAASSSSSHTKADSNASRAKAAGSAATSRLASLFGGTGSTSHSNRSSALLQANATPSDPSNKGLFSLDKEPEVLPPLSVNAILVDRIVAWSDVTASISDSIALHLRSDLLGAFQAERLNHHFDNLEELTDLVVDFLKRFQPPLHLKQSSAAANWDWLPPSPSKLKAKDQEKCDLSLFSDPSGQLSADLASNAVQDVFEIVRQSLRQPSSSDASNIEKQPPLDDFEEAVDRVIEIIEATLTSLLYNKLFSMQCAGDVADDETLSSRIAGLGLLQLTLTHLGLDLDVDEDYASDTPSSDEKAALSHKDLHHIHTGLEQLVRATGMEMKKLSDADRRSPASKLDILIQTHKLIVEKLSELPPIPMRREQPSVPDNASISSRPQGSEVEMTDDARSLGGRSRAPSPPPGLEHTPRPSSMHRFESSEGLPEIHLSDPAIHPSGESGEKVKERKKGSSADVILPVLIYCVVQANPQQLASNLAFISRFRAESLQAGGESMYCLVNFQAVVGFLLTVDVESLGLDSDKILDGDEVAPSGSSAPSFSSQTPSIRFKNEFDNIAGHVSSTINGVSGMVGFFLNKTAASAPGKTLEDVRSVLSGSSEKMPAQDLKDEEGNDIKESIGAGILRRARARSKSVASTLSRQEPTAEAMREKELQDVYHAEDGAQEESFSSDPSKAAESSFTASPDPSRSSIGNRISALARFGSGSSASLLPTVASLNNNAAPAPSSNPRSTAQSIFASFSPATSLRSGASSINEASPPTQPFALPQSDPVSTRARRDSSDVQPLAKFMQTKSAMELPLGDVQLLLDDYKRLARLLELQQAQRTGIIGDA